MNSNNKIIAGVIGAVVVIGVVYVFYIQPQPTQAPDTTADNIPSQSGVNGEPPAPSVSGGGGIDVNVALGVPMSATVTYNGTSFFPSVVTVKKGGTVTFNNQSSGGMWVGSSQHPTHADYDSTTASEHCAVGYTGVKPFDQCASGTSFSFTFTKTGSFKYHNHVNTSTYGTITVVD